MFFVTADSILKKEDKEGCRSFFQKKYYLKAKKLLVAHSTRHWCIIWVKEPLGKEHVIDE